VRPADQLEAKPIAVLDNVYYAGLFFSPDGRWLGYVTAGKLKKVPATGGASITLCDLPRFAGASWGPDDTII
jgi:hypothetical protein